MTRQLHTLQKKKKTSLKPRLFVAGLKYIKHINMNNNNYHIICTFFMKSNNI